MQEAGNSSVEQLAQEENETLIRLLSLACKRRDLTPCQPNRMLGPRQRLGQQYIHNPL